MGHKALEVFFPDSIRISFFFFISQTTYILGISPSFQFVEKIFEICVWCSCTKDIKIWASFIFKQGFQCWILPKSKNKNTLPSLPGRLLHPRTEILFLALKLRFCVLYFTKKIYFRKIYLEIRWFFSLWLSLYATTIW